MIKINSIKRASKLVKNNRYVSFVWHKKDCPVCVHFLEELEGVEDDCSEFIFSSVDYDLFKDNMIFEPEQLPMTFIFKDGKRLVCPIGEGRREDVLQTHRDIISGTFKTPQEMELDQLNKIE